MSSTAPINLIIRLVRCLWVKKWPNHVEHRPSKTCSESWNWHFTFSLRRDTIWRPSTKGPYTVTSLWTRDLGWPLRDPDVLCFMCWWRKVRGQTQRDHSYPHGDWQRYGAVDSGQPEQFCLSLRYWIRHMIGLIKRLIWDKETTQGLIMTLIWLRVRYRSIEAVSCGFTCKMIWQN